MSTLSMAKVPLLTVLCSSLGLSPRCQCNVLSLVTGFGSTVGLHHLQRRCRGGHLLVGESAEEA